MSSIVTSVFKVSIGLLVNKGRDEAAEKLKDGDVTDEKFRALIVRELDEVKSKLDGLSRKDLLASISFFKEGIELLYEVFDEARSQSGFGAVTALAACAEKVCLAELQREMKNLKLNDLNESVARKLCTAKESFKDARRKATEAFNNEAIETSDRILAMQYRVMATILETVDNPADALARCRVCIDDLHSMAAVKNCFNVQLKKGIQRFWKFFSKEERREIISNVCHVNRVICDVAAAVGHLFIWICPAHVIDTGKEKVELLSDERVSKVLRKHGMEHCCLKLGSFGQEGEKEHKLKNLSGIATNLSGEFIVGEFEDGHVKVFDSSGKFVKYFSLPTGNVNTNLKICEVATDLIDNIFVLTILEKPGTERSWWVYKLTKTGDLHHKFRLGEEEDWYNGLQISDAGKVMTLRGRTVEEYDTNGEFVRSFGEGILKKAVDISVANDGRLIVLDENGPTVHIFSEHSDHHNQFKLQRSFDSIKLTFNRAGDYVVVASMTEQLLLVEIYTNNGEFVRSAQIQQKRSYWLNGIALTTDGRLAVALIFDSTKENKVLVL